MNYCALCNKELGLPVFFDCEPPPTRFCLCDKHAEQLMNGPQPMKTLIIETVKLFWLEDNGYTLDEQEAKLETLGGRYLELTEADINYARDMKRAERKAKEKA